MNVLILTPDAVGSTFLQRMLTVYMQFHDFDKPVINLHELSNGLARYYSPEFNCEIVSKKVVKNNGYYQSLQEIIELLSSVDHYKTSRLAHYHIIRRGDTVREQIPFYQYLNDNFYIIACQRHNVFEHAISLALTKVTKKLNVYSPVEKIHTFYEIYRSGIAIDPKVFLQQLHAYKNYLDWSHQYFDIAKYFNYEQDVPDIEEFILNLPVFGGQKKKITWQKNFGMNFNTWNKLHYARSDIGNLHALSLDTIQNHLLTSTSVIDQYQKLAPQSNPPVFSMQDVQNLPDQIKKDFVWQLINQQGLVDFMPELKKLRMTELKHRYEQAQDTINSMIKLGIVPSGPPIKKQTLAEKKNIIKNFYALLEIYNEWITNNDIGCSILTEQDIDNAALIENQFWNFTHDSTSVVPELPHDQL